MKQLKIFIFKSRTTLLLFMMTLFLTPGISQDTLHLIYHHTQTKAHDTTLARIDNWIKSLNGRHVDITVVGYFHKPEFKPYAKERVDEMFLILNRKARELFTFGEFTTKKGKDYQRTMVDIIYKPTLTAEEAAKIKAAEEAVKAEEAKKKEAAKATKGEDKKTAGKTPAEKNKKEAGKDGEEKEVKKSDKKSSEEKEGKEDKMESDEEDKDVAYSTVVTFNEGYVLTLEEVNYIKDAKFIIAQTGDQNMDENLQKAVKDCWNFTSEVSSMPYKDARALGKENKKDKIVILSIAQVKTWFVVKSFGYSYRVLKLGRSICLENGSGKTLYKQIIPVARGIGVTKEYMMFGVSFMNSLFKNRSENKIEKSTKVNYMSKKDAAELKETPLLIAESMMHPKFPVEDIPKYYSGKVQIVSDQAWKDAILQKKDVAYVMIVKVPSTSNGCWHYILNAKTGKAYLFDVGPTFQMSMSVGVTKNLDPSQSGYVDKANFERYEKAMAGEEAKESKKKEKEKEKK